MFTRTSKPWGYEDRMLFHDSSAIIHLSLEPGFSTSIHSHPTKTTSMLCLNGDGLLKFVNSSDVIFPNEGFTIRSGLFHCISNTSYSNTLEMLEFEFPVGADSLSRLDDSNGRKNSIYETREPIEKSPLLDFFANAVESESLNYSKARLTLCEFPRLAINSQDAEYAIVVLKGGLWDPETGHKTLQAPEYIKGSAFIKLIKRFEVIYGSVLLKIESIG